MKPQTPSAPNALCHETSPYLLQHADNPVHWYPWGEEAIGLARAENKPILLSIGYSACHWCHVMAHESFEDPATAKVMNELFINIKVDREERPDLDKIYQTAHYLLTRRNGGWPLTLVLNPQDHTPFFAGTYFPREPRHGLPAFTSLLRQVEGFYRQRGDELKKQDDSLREVLARMHIAPSAECPDARPLADARQQLEKAFDRRYAGFGQAPKFPHPTNLDRLLRHWAATSDDEEADTNALEMVRLTLHAMGSGGMFDQLGGGFCRYSVDDQWMIPHFEKMLYDNGPLLTLYAEAYAATGEAAFADIATDTADWVMREMQSPNGGYYSTLDADSEGEEGKFYVWTPTEVKSHLDTEAYAVFSRHFGLDRKPNFEGAWHLHVFRGLPEIAEELGITVDTAEACISRARESLFAVREQRIHPGRDEKILTSWNGLMIKGMATAGRLLDRQDWIASAQRALDFIRAQLWQDGRLLATHKDGKSHLMAYLDDYVFLIDGILALLQARWRDGDLAFAITLAETTLAHFEDKRDGGFYFTADDHEQLLQRPKSFTDEAIPSGNGIAAQVLNRLGHLLGEPRYLDAVERTLQAAWTGMTEMPRAHTALLTALEEWLQPPQTIVLRGSEASLQTWLTRCHAGYAPHRVCLPIPAQADTLPGLLAQRVSQGDCVAWVCSRHTCQPPITDIEAFQNVLDETTASR
ncbi:thioredoxin domain-containing protein [Sulfuriflexus mobilis]|uniref:thioredoxin domain-containing protein n=1 Tax=Sulfuriflexus mobilis TaxID=1811807 RepID=UPI000F82811D|nr:thioredoxin domain-containing protein [Sulfuriflexus mobilis]